MAHHFRHATERWAALAARACSTLPRISQMSPAGLACDLRHNPENQGYFAHSCHVDRKTRWVTAKTGSCGSISMAV